MNSLPKPVCTGNPVIDNFFRELDARISDGDSSIPAAQKAMLKKVRPEFLQVALADPDYFARELVESASAILSIGRG